VVVRHPVSCCSVVDGNDDDNNSVGSPCLHTHPRRLGKPSAPVRKRVHPKHDHPEGHAKADSTVLHQCRLVDGSAWPHCLKDAWHITISTTEPNVRLGKMPRQGLGPRYRESKLPRIQQAVTNAHARQSIIINTKMIFPLCNSYLLLRSAGLVRSQPIEDLHKHDEAHRADPRSLGGLGHSPPARESPVEDLYRLPHGLRALESPANMYV
jgi:hypothetical protein